MWMKCGNEGSIPWDEALEGDKSRSYHHIVDAFRFILTKGNGK